MLNTAKTSVAL